MAAAAPATTITVEETLQKLLADFAAVAQAVESGGFALWVGSGISRRAPSLGAIIARALESLRVSATAPGANPVFEAALKEAMNLAKVAWGDVLAHLGTPFLSWPQADVITNELWEKYADLLDIRVGALADDYMLWNAVDVRTAFSNPAPPACEHLCIAILVLEGALTEIVSANWDGFIEAAVDRLSGGASSVLQVVVDPNHLRDAPGRARLLKFHGCVVHATQAPDLYRGFLIGAASQITFWQTQEAYKAIRTEVVTVATRKAMMVGLSLQDPNLQWVFGEARAALKWPWPVTPAAQGHVFCENAIGAKQRAMLKVVYGDTYTPNSEEIEKSALLQSWPEQVLLALTLKLLCDKLVFLASKALEDRPPLVADAAVVSAGVAVLRSCVAAMAVGDRTAFTNQAIAAWSRGMRFFRNGQLPTSSDTYEAISATGMGHIANDANALASGLGEAAIGLALLGEGQAAGDWAVAPPAGSEIVHGALQVTGSYADAMAAQVFFVRGAAEAIALRKQGAFANDNVVVVHSDDAWAEMQNTNSKPTTRRRPTRPPGRTGATPPRHISIRELINSASSMAAMSTKFRERAGL